MYRVWGQGCRRVENRLPSITGQGGSYRYIDWKRVCQGDGPVVNRSEDLYKQHDIIDLYQI